MKRRKVLEKKKAMEEVIKAASTVKDHLSSFPSFRRYDRNGKLWMHPPFLISSPTQEIFKHGFHSWVDVEIRDGLSVYLETGLGEQLSSCMKRYIQTLLKINMVGPYGVEWPTEEKVKRREMVAPDARYIFVRDTSNAKANEMSSTGEKEVNCMLWMGGGDPVVGFVQFRFILEEEIPVVYVYELQLEPRVQGKGLGNFLMQLIELIAHKNCMSAVMLTVQKENLHAMNFYMNRLRYMISTISPSKVDPLIGAEKSYEILCKTFDHEAKAKLEGDGSTLSGL